MTRYRVRSIAFGGLMIALAMALSYLESLIPIYFGAPGIKPGFANMIMLFYFYKRKYYQGLVVNILRIALTGFMFGNLFSILYSMSGALLSFAVLRILSMKLWEDRISIVIKSVIAGMTHNIGQFLCALIVLRSPGLWYYVPVLLLAGGIAGILTGSVISVMKPALKRLEL